MSRQRKLLSIVCAATVALLVLPTSATESLVITPQGKLIPKELVTAEIASRVAIAEDIAVLGDPADDEKGHDAGAIYVFSRSGGVWQENAKIFANDAHADQSFGHAMAIAGNTMIIGAPKVTGGRGAAYVLSRASNGWVQETKLTAPLSGQDLAFGRDVAISEDRLIVASPRATIANSPLGVIFVYQHRGGHWVLEATLTACDSSGNGGDVVAISGTTIASTSFASNRVCVYEYVADKWTLEAVLVPNSSLLTFGGDVALFGNTLVVGATGPIPGITDRGIAVIFHREHGLWTEEATLEPSDAHKELMFGAPVAIWRDTVIVGAHGHDGTLMNSGAAYLFQRSNGKWKEVSKLLPNIEVGNSYFGAAVAISANSALVGASLDKPKGSASVYEIMRNPGAACDAPEQCSTGFCVNHVCCDSACISSEPGTCMACSIRTGAQHDGICSVALFDVCPRDDAAFVASGCSCWMGSESVGSSWIGTVLLPWLLWRRRKSKG
jgi:hypothetical protein